MIPRTPDYLVIGHIARDLLAGGGSAPGGTAIYSALAAQALGLQAAVVTACADSDEHLLQPLYDAGVWVRSAPSPTTTTFTNRYDATGRRTQLIGARAASISLEDVPDGWQDARIVHLGPVAQEIPKGFITAFPDSLLGVTPQGWLRAWGGGGVVSSAPLPVPETLTLLRPGSCLVMSMEDLGFDEGVLQTYVNLTECVIVTNGPAPAFIFERGAPIQIDAFPAQPSDLTGAGDVFATALFVRIAEGASPAAAAGFAHAAASLFIRAPGATGFASRREVEALAGSAISGPSGSANSCTES